MAKKSKIRYYDCPLFPIPTSIESYSVNSPSLFLGGEQAPDEQLLSLLFSLGKAIFPANPTQGIVNKFLVTVCL